MDIRSAISGAIPPKPGDHNGQVRWQWAVFMKLWLLIFFAFWALDAVPGFPGLARADDVQQLQQNVSAIQADLLESSLLVTRREQCKSMVEGNAQARAFYAEKLMALQKRYIVLFGYAWDVPPCDSI